MTDAGPAAAAEALIRIARDRGWTDLPLSEERIAGLTRLPREVRTLTGVTGIDANWTGLADISALDGMTWLTGLELASCPVADIGPLKGMRGLQVLDLSDTRVTDLTPAHGTTALVELMLDGIALTRADTRWIARNTGLRRLSLNGCGVADAGFVAALTALEWLELGHNPIVDAAPLASLTRLRQLCLHATDLPHDGLSPLRGLTRLAEAPLGHGLTLRDSAATRADPRLAEIFADRNPGTCTRDFFAYLDACLGAR